MPTPSSKAAYQAAGVDLDMADAVTSIAKRLAQQTMTKHVLSGVGGFSAGFRLPEGLRQPVLLAACDGVGTKLKLAQQLNRHSTIGIDLVAMSVNDILVSGGQPLAFLDYIATSRIEPSVIDAILQGVAEGCLQSDCALIGGETAEMPGMYTPGEYDLAGFCVGVVEQEKQLPNTSAIRPGDKLIGLASSGLHSNGYSLVRKILSDHQIDLDSMPQGWDCTVADAVLVPTRIYVKPVLKLLNDFPGVVKSMVHITGGGFYDNIPRVLPDHLGVHIHAGSWPELPVFSWLQQLGGFSDESLYHTFNAGIGFILVVPQEQAESVLKGLQDDYGHDYACLIGDVVECNGSQPQVVVA